MPESLDYGLAENHSETDKFDEKERTDRKRERERARVSGRRCDRKGRLG